MNVNESDRLGEITPQRDAVVHVHEFGRDEPGGESPVFHPVMAKKQEIAVKPGEPADVETERFPEPRLEAGFLGYREMMMPNVRRVRKDEREASIGHGLLCEISFYHTQTRCGPQGAGALCKERVEFNTDRRFDAMRGSLLAKSREK